MTAGGDNRTPDVGRHLIGCVAAKSLEAQSSIMADIAGPVFDQTSARSRRVVVELGQVAPNRLLLRIIGVCNTRTVERSIDVPSIPFRMLMGERRILRAVVDDQVHHDMEIVPLSFAREMPQQR